MQCRLILMWRRIRHGKDNIDGFPHGSKVMRIADFTIISRRPLTANSLGCLLPATVIFATTINNLESMRDNVKHLVRGG